MDATSSHAGFTDWSQRAEEIAALPLGEHAAVFNAYADELLVELQRSDTHEADGGAA